METTKTTKKQIRSQIYAERKRRSDQYIEENSLRICRKLYDTEAFQQAAWIYIYIDYNHEVMTGEIIKKAHSMKKKVAAPRVEGKEMRFLEIAGLQDLEPGYFGIREPKQTLNPAGNEEVLMIMPGVAFDIHRHRIGYGGGFYDRYLEKHPEIATAALAFEFQIFEEIPFEPLDILPDQIITENRIL